MINFIQLHLSGTFISIAPTGLDIYYWSVSTKILPLWGVHVTIDRTTNGYGKLSDYSWQELKRFRLKDHPGDLTNIGSILLPKQ